LLSIAIAWLVRPRDDSETAVEAVGLVISAAAFEQARRKKWTR
jgi:hypothetical protein